MLYTQIAEEGNSQGLFDTSAAIELVALYDPKHAIEFFEYMSPPYGRETNNVITGPEFFAGAYLGILKAYNRLEEEGFCITNGRLRGEMPAIILKFIADKQDWLTPSQVAKIDRLLSVEITKLARKSPEIVFEIIMKLAKEIEAGRVKIKSEGCTWDSKPLLEQIKYKGFGLLGHKDGILAIGQRLSLKNLFYDPS